MSAVSKALHDRHTALIYRAMALRLYCQYVQFRLAAEAYNADENFPEHPQTKSGYDADEDYRLAAENCVFEVPGSAGAVAAAVEYVGLIARDHTVCVGDLFSPAEERDAFHQGALLAGIARWLEELSRKEFAGKLNQEEAAAEAASGRVAGAAAPADR